MLLCRDLGKGFIRVADTSLIGRESSPLMKCCHLPKEKNKDKKKQKAKWCSLINERKQNKTSGSEVPEQPQSKLTEMMLLVGTIRTCFFFNLRKLAKHLFETRIYHMNIYKLESKEESSFSSILLLHITCKVTYEKSLFFFQQYCLIINIV